MSAPAIQSMSSATSPVQFAPGVDRATASNATMPGLPLTPAATPADSPSVALELSQLARALEKLAQLPGMDEHTLARVMVLVKSQGESDGLLRLLTSGASPSSQTPTLPADLKPVAEALKALWAASAGEGSAPTASNAAPAGAPDLQAKVAQAFQNFLASAKGALAPLFEGAPAGSAPNASNNTLNPAALKASLTQFVQTQFEQVSALFKQYSSPTPAPAPAGAAPLATTTANPLTALPDAAVPAQALAEELRQFKTAGKLLDTPLLRTEYIRATLGVVAALLSDPTPTKAATPPSAAPANPAQSQASSTSRWCNSLCRTSCRRS